VQELRTRLEEEQRNAREAHSKLHEARAKLQQHIDETSTTTSLLISERDELRQQVEHLQQLKPNSVFSDPKNGGYVSDEKIDKLLSSKVSIPQLVVLLNNMAKENNVNLRTFLLHNQGAASAKPSASTKQPIKKPAAKAAATMKKLKVVDGDLRNPEQVKGALRVVGKDEKRKAEPTHLADVLYMQLQDRFQKVNALDAEDLETDESADFEDDF